jgi:hypothetical protein
VINGPLMAHDRVLVSYRSARRSGLCVAGGRQKTWRPFSPVVELDAVTRSAGAVCKVTLSTSCGSCRIRTMTEVPARLSIVTLGVRNMGVLRSFCRSLGWRELPIGDEIPSFRGGSRQGARTLREVTGVQASAAP